MKYCWLIGFIMLFPLTLVMSGCSSSSSADQSKPLVTDDYLTRGQTQLESVTTNLYMNSLDADRVLRSAARDFATVLQSDPKNTKAKMGITMAYTFEGLFNLTDVLPLSMSSAMVNLLAQSSLTKGPLEMPIKMAQNAVQRRARSSVVLSNQTQIASATLPHLTQMLPYLEDVESDVRSGAKVQLRMYQGGKIRTVDFDVADIQLLSAFSNLIASVLNLSISFNLDMPDGMTVRLVPVDANSNGMLEAQEYLISSPFLDRLVNSNTQGLAGALLYLRNAATKASQGASLSGHTLGANALIDVTDANVQQALSKLSTYAFELTLATQSQVPIGTSYFHDGVSRTLNLPGVLSITSLRGLMPTFPKDNPTAPGIWPDPTFRGVITPGIPQDAFQLTYHQVENAYK